MQAKLFLRTPTGLACGQGARGRSRLAASAHERRSAHNIIYINTVYKTQYSYMWTRAQRSTCLSPAFCASPTAMRSLLQGVHQRTRQLELCAVGSVASMIGAMAPRWASACCLAAVGRHACAHKPLGTLWQNIVGSVQALVKRFGSE